MTITKKTALRAIALAGAVFGLSACADGYGTYDVGYGYGYGYGYDYGYPYDYYGYGPYYSSYYGSPYYYPTSAGPW